MGKNIKLFLVKSFAHTPLCNERDLVYFNENGIFLTENINDADVIISQNFKHLQKYFWRFLKNKKFLVWTLEPRFDTYFTEVRKAFFGLIKCHVMNIYTGDVFTDGLTFTVQDINRELILLSKDSQIQNKKIVALISFFGGTNAPVLIRDGRDIDLIKIRSEIALEGYKMGVLDIYGKGWPESIAMEDSREGNWKGRKTEILRDYSFNLCFENTIATNYITEKIWDSIENYCLPIYYGKGNNIYEIFPENSFLDYSLFGQPKELFHYIQEMTDGEYIERLNKCIAVYNGISSKGKYYSQVKRQETLDKLVSKLKRICDGPENFGNS